MFPDKVPKRAADDCKETFAGAEIFPSANTLARRVWVVVWMSPAPSKGKNISDPARSK
jgi:hypothetical protein